MYENSNGNSYSSWTNNSGNSYTYVTNHITVQDSFNTTGSHNGRMGGGCVVAALVLVLPALVAIYMLFDTIARALT